MSTLCAKLADKIASWTGQSIGHPCYEKPEKIAGIGKTIQSALIQKK